MAGCGQGTKETEATMIRYSLVCEAEHGFESWFRDSEAFSDQSETGLITCPQCGSANVRKSMMAPALARKGDRGAVPPEPSAPSQETAARESTASEPTAPVALVSEKEREIHALMRAVKQYVEAHSDDVGRQFPDEARRMHAGEIEKRAIRGEARPGEVAALIEEGIQVLPIPILPEERN